MEELREVVFSMNPMSAPGLNGMNGSLFQINWHVINQDLMGEIKAFSVSWRFPSNVHIHALYLYPSLVTLEK